MAEYRFEAALWKHEAEAPWHFVTLPHEMSDDIEATVEPRPFGSVPVRARIGGTSWETSLFPDEERNSYLLPVKRSVRRAESIGEGDTVDVRLAV